MSTTFKSFTQTLTSLTRCLFLELLGVSADLVEGVRPPSLPYLCDLQQGHCQGHHAVELRITIQDYPPSSVN